ncbi:MAG: LysE family translocator [Parachlamydiaceae bacterium]
MFSNLFFTGIVIGFSIALPVGPIGLLCIRNTLTHGLLCGFISGLGAATADAFYGAIAGFGLTIIGNFLLSYQRYLQFFGALFLCYLGVKIFRSHPPKIDREKPVNGYLWLFFSTLFLTLSNPMTLLIFIGVYAGFGVGAVEDTQWRDAFLLTFGVFVGSALWWLLLSGITSLFHKAMTPQTFRWLNRISGSLIFTFGVLILLALLDSYIKGNL